MLRLVTAMQAHRRSHRTVLDDVQERAIMISLITENRDAIAELCREYRIKRLDLFGSAATGAFDPATSDIDFIVDLGGYEPGVSRRYYRFAEALEALLQRPVELLTEEQIRDPYFRETVESNKVNVYRSGDREEAA
jgi:predicted nucleotidyltransferase